MGPVVSDCMVNKCDFVNPDGTVSDRQAAAAQNAVGELSFNEREEILQANFNNTRVEDCIRSQQSGLSQAAIGLGVLGLGAVAVALSQRGD